MSVELIQILSLISYVVAVVFFLVTIALFFLLNIPKVFGDITGANARKAIENIRQQNEISGDKAYKPSPVNAVRGKITDKISPSGKIKSRTNGIGVAVETEKLTAEQLVRDAQETTVLNDIGSETTVLSALESESTVLNSEGKVGETTVLIQDENVNGFSVDIEIGFTGSSEIIE